MFALLYLHYVLVWLGFSMSEKSKSIGILGGTFDPIHFGHLRAALELYQILKLDEMRLIPCQNPPHRHAPTIAASHRFNMASLAVENSPLQVDDREMKRQGPSYTFDTLMSLRQEFPVANFYMVLGADAFLGLHSWYLWEKLIQLTNIVIIHRVGWEFPTSGSMADFFNQHLMPRMETNDAHHSFQFGKIFTQSITALDIQASRIRSIIALGESPQFLLPDKVMNYIQKNGLYQESKNGILRD